MPRPPTIVSAPGKVLFAGGYLALDRAYTALVIATSSRFYCVVRSRQQDLSSSSTSSPSSTSSTSKDNTASTTPRPAARIVVRAGQFPADVSTWSYTLKSSIGGDVELVSERPDARNKFVEITLKNALRVVIEWKSRESGRAFKDVAEEVISSIEEEGELEVVVLANNDFYSQREQLKALSLPPLYSSLDSLEPFTPLPRAIHKTNKTGLGSSAALVTSLTAGILSHFGIISIPPPTCHSGHTAQPTSSPTQSSQSSSTHLDLVHNLSQFSHCLAQGKVGSGFDISSAVFGTHIYRRFSPSVLSELMSSTPPSDLLPSLDPSSWDHTTLPFSLPRGLRLMLADVDAGTDTPSFVGKVLKWREQNADEANALWEKLGKANEDLGDCLREMAGLEGENGYEGVLVAAAGEKIGEISDDGPVAKLLVKMRDLLLTIRSHIRKMSQLSDVPIEPPEQTRLLDACSDLPGVIGGTVPGAGGYDALVLLVIDQPSVISSVEGVWAGWEELSVCPLTAKQSDGGIQSESLEGVKGLKERLGW